MADQTNESILFEIKINSEQYKSEQKLIRDSLQQLTLDIEKTKAAQKALSEERKAGKLTDQQYAEQSVKLREQLKGQTADQRELEKGLATSQKAYNAAAGSAEQLRAQLAELATAYYSMSEAERKSAEGQAVQKQALAVSEALKAIEFSVGSTGRNVGNYAASFKQGLAPIVAELAKVEAAMKGVDANSEEGALLNQKRIGFMTAAQRAAAQAGITDFTQAKAVIDQYAQAFTPAVENLVQLQREQQQAGQTVGENSEQYQQLGFRVAGAQKALDDVVAAQVAAEKAGQATTTAAVQQGQATTAAAGSLGALRQQLLDLLNTRETLDPTTKEAETLNTQILELRTNIQQAEGKIDEFGERVQKNIKKENFDTVSDAIQGMAGATALATLVFGENTDAAAAQAKALQLMAIAQNARAIAIGLDSARDAAAIVLLKAKSLFLKEEVTLTAAATVSTEAHAAVAGADAAAVEAQAGAAVLNAEGQAASAEATVASTVATEAQAVATEGATVAQEALNVALKLNPVGLVIIAVAALVSLFAVYRNASDATQKKIRDITETFLRFSNPIGLIYTGIEKLYQKFAAVRAVLDPLINGFNKVATEVKANAIAFAQYIGLMDTAIERAAKLAAAELEHAGALREQADAEIKLLESTGATAREVTQQKLAALAQQLRAATANDAAQQALHAKDLQRIRERQAAGEQLSEKDKKVVEETNKARLTLTNLITEQSALVAEGVERDRAARQQEAADIQTNAQRAVAVYRRRLEEGIANEKAALQSRIDTLDRGLAAVRLNSVEELELQRKKVLAQRNLELLNLGPTLAQEQAVRRKFLAQELAENEVSRKIELDKQSLSAQEKAHIEKTYSDKAADLRLAYSTAEAQREVQARQDIAKNASIADLKLTTDYLRQQSILSLQAEQERNAAALALNAQAQAERAAQNLQATEQQLTAQYNLQNRAAVLERELALASLTQRTDNAAAEYRIRAEASQKLADLAAGQADAERQRRAKALGEEAQYYNLLADGMLAGLDQSEQAQVQATETYKQQRIAATFDEQDTRLALVAAGSQEEVNIRQETQNKLKQIQADSSKAQLDLLKAQTEKVAAVITGSLNSLAAIQDADSQAKVARIDAEMNKEGVSVARKAIFEKQKVRLEQQAAEERRKISRAMAVVQLGQAVMTILAEESVLPSPLAEIAKGIEIAAATATAYAQFRAIDSAKFSQGGIVQGPSHASGGVQMWHRSGAHVGEMEGGEAIMSVGAVRRFGGLLSQLNVAGGGRAFDKMLAIPSRYMEGGIVSSSAEILPQIRTGGVVVHTPPIDYAALVAAMAAQPADHEALADVLAAKLAPAFVAGAQALPAQNVNLTELREKNTQLDKRDSQTNI